MYYSNPPPGPPPPLILPFVDKDAENDENDDEDLNHCSHCLIYLKTPLSWSPYWKPGKYQIKINSFYFKFKVLINKLSFKLLNAPKKSLQTNQEEKVKFN